jgi:pimeloyl-ACP methyl ester carboxylesterase
MSRRLAGAWKLFGGSAALAAALVLAACAGSTAKVDPAETALGDLPGRWENLFVEVETPQGPLKFHYVAAGPKDAPRVLLLHGFPDFAYTWREVVPLLSRDHRVLAPDLRGYAATAKPKDGYDLDTLAGDVVAFADAAAAADGAPADASTHLVGHDWGAAIGWWAVLKAPTRFASYTALSVGHPRAFTEYLERSPEQRKKSRYMRTLTLPGVPAIFAGMKDRRRRGLYRDPLTRKEAFGDEQLVWYRTAFDSTFETRGPIRYYKQRQRRRAANEQAAREAAKVGIPVLVLWGKRDKYLQWEMAADSCKYVDPGKCTVHVFPEASHWPHWDDPAGVVRQWRAFVAAAGAAAAETPATDAGPKDGAVAVEPAA